MTAAGEAAGGGDGERVADPSGVDRQRGPLPPAISFFKTLVRVARVAAGPPFANTFAPALGQALAILPWMPDHYRAARGTKIPHGLYGTRMAKLARYTTGEGLSPRKQAEIQLARAMLAEGRAVPEHELIARLRPAPSADEATGGASEVDVEDPDYRVPGTPGSPAFAVWHVFADD
jgi:hypothetical protein